MTEGPGRAGVKKFGSGRIVLSGGSSLWIGHAEEETGFHAHHAIQVTLSLSGGQVRLKNPGEEWGSYQAAIIAAHHSHAFEARGELVALIFTEPESLEGRILRARYRSGISPLVGADIAGEISALGYAFQNKDSDEKLMMRARAVAHKLASMQSVSPKLIDKRIQQAVTLLRERLGDVVTMAEIADSVHLSPERFRHLFLQETGIRFRPYVLWLRMEVAVAAYAAGHNLTEAAQAGGFADAAHFSRSFKRMFGVQAVGVQRA
ncbi:AraC family transcriptional regulator [Candidimonas sp. SYP-B2681]|uniref:helix-turn-helix transcriptional regulator n=1 Tax=Candidimonas sp. SYP-B2681 TaxID=2497686 RepID=UPI000F85CB00|nr:AraC family transcriptional regulator [Candidimonas sp. SYP-B2681]RTZ47608.1 AraC family transcriptional regulator [Candidimonas sp. SYP-B2681]